MLRLYLQLILQTSCEEWKNLSEKKAVMPIWRPLAKALRLGSYSKSFIEAGEMLRQADAR